MRQAVDNLPLVGMYAPLPLTDKWPTGIVLHHLRTPQEFPLENVKHVSNVGPHTSTVFCSRFFESSCGPENRPPAVQIHEPGDCHLNDEIRRVHEEHVLAYLVGIDNRFPVLKAVCRASVNRCLNLVVLCAVSERQWRDGSEELQVVGQLARAVL